MEAIFVTCRLAAIVSFLAPKSTHAISRKYWQVAPGEKARVAE